MMMKAAPPADVREMATFGRRGFWGRARFAGRPVLFELCAVTGRRHLSGWPAPATAARRRG